MTRSVFDHIARLQSDLIRHPVFKLIQTPQHLQLFMRWHVFAVWDFMSLTKRLQRDLTRTDETWLPAPIPLACRLINDIVLAEESDVLPSGGYASHFDMYRQAMQDVEADRSQIDQFIGCLQTGQSLEQALSTADVEPEIRRFVSQTFAHVRQGSLLEVLGSFFYGREDMIPAMFTRLLEQWQLNENDAPMFVYYLKRHIELDSDEHGPAARSMIDQMVGDDASALQQLENGALQAIQARIDFWDALAKRLS